MQPKCLTASNDSRHSFIVRQTKTAIESLMATGKRISFYSVAKMAQVSRSTLYRCDDLRKLVIEARNTNAISNTALSTDAATIAELQRQLAQVTFERDMLRQAVRNSHAYQYAVMCFENAA